MLSFAISSFSNATKQSFFVPYQILDFKIGTGTHGSSYLDIKAISSRAQIYNLYANNGDRKIEVYSSGTPVWVGKIEDVSFGDGNTVSIAAFGQWAALDDIPITGFWSSTKYEEWAEVNSNEAATYMPNRYAIDTEGRLFVALKSGEEYSNTVFGGLSWEVPHGGISDVQTFSFSYAVNLPATYRAQVLSCDHDLTGATSLWTLDGNGSLQSGSAALSSISANRLIFRVFYNSGSPNTYTGETEVSYATLSAIRIKSTTESTVDTSLVVREIYDYVRSQNPAVFPNPIFVESAGRDVMDVRYEDAPASDIIDNLGEYGNADGQKMRLVFDPNWQAVFRDEDTLRGLWQATVVSFGVTRTIKNAPTAVRVKYQDEFQRVRRTGLIYSTETQNDYGFEKVEFVEMSTTSQSEAEEGGLTYINATDRDVPQAEITLLDPRPVYQLKQAPEYIRGGDRILLQGIDYSLDNPANNVNEMDVLSAEYDAVANVLTLSLGTPANSVDEFAVRALSGTFDFVEV